MTDGPVVTDGPAVIEDAVDSTTPRGIADCRHRGFDDWLRAQRVTGHQRRCTHQRVDHYLRWRRIELAAATTSATAVWCYLRRLHQDGLEDASIIEVWAALRLYLDYRADTPSAPAATGSPALSTL